MCGGWKARLSGEASLVCCEFLSLVRLLVPGLKEYIYKLFISIKSKQLNIKN